MFWVIIKCRFSHILVQYISSRRLMFFFPRPVVMNRHRTNSSLTVPFNQTAKQTVISQKLMWNQSNFNPNLVILYLLGFIRKYLEQTILLEEQFPLDTCKLGKNTMLWNIFPFLFNEVWFKFLIFSFSTAVTLQVRSRSQNLISSLVCPNYISMKMNPTTSSWYCAGKKCYANAKGVHTKNNMSSSP